MSNYTYATLEDGSKVVLYRAASQGDKMFYWVAEVRHGGVRLGTWVSRRRGSMVYRFEEMA